MEHVHSAFRDVAASLRWFDSAPRTRVWEPNAWTLVPNVTGQVLELPLFTLAPKWFEYYAYIGVGTPRQYMRVALDTMSSDLSLLGYDFSRHEMYNHNKSNSYVANNTLVRTMLPGTDDIALGVLSQERITLHPDLHLTNQSFTELLDRIETNEYFDNTLADGWLGLGRSKLQEAYPAASVVSRLVHGSLLPDAIVGIHLNPATTGLVSFGGVNTKRFEGELRYINVVPLTSEAVVNRDRLWSFQLDGILINGKPVVTTDNQQYSGGMAVVDAVLPLIRGPRDIVNAINAALGQDEGLRVPCTGTNGVNITFVMGGQSFVLKREELVVTASNGPGCLSLVAPTPPVIAAWVIGAPFLQAYYTALDYGSATQPPRIGFAKSKREIPPSFSAYDELWLVLLVLVVVLIMRSLGRRRPSIRKSQE